CSTPVMPVSDYPYTATYSGDANWAGPITSTSVFHVLPLQPTLNAIATPSSSPVGTTVLLAGTGLPTSATGTITFTSGGVTLCSYTLASAFSCATSDALAAGIYPVTAQYSGDANNNPGSAQTTFTLTPTAPPEQGTTLVGQPVTVALPGTSGHITITQQPPTNQGACSVTAAGSVIFTPATGYSGIATCSYTVTVGGVTSPPAVVTITVNPLAIATSGTAGDGGGVGQLPTPQGVGPFTYVITAQPPASEGVCAITSNGTLAFYRAAGYSGTANCKYKVIDGSGNLSATALISVIVKPTAFDTSASTMPGHTVTVKVPTAQGKAPFTYTLKSGPSKSIGSWTFSKAGTLSFYPYPGTNGVVTFTYTATDATKAVSNVAKITIRIGNSGTMIPGAHTGEPWSGSLYWYLVSLALLAGSALLLFGRRRRAQA
ncbi:MAG TPA: Ig-like domain-containing protein, partial [Acidimicrobiales bacterium]